MNRLTITLMGILIVLAITAGARARTGIVQLVLPLGSSAILACDEGAPRYTPSGPGGTFSCVGKEP